VMLLFYQYVATSSLPAARTLPSSGPCSTVPDPLSPCRSFVFSVLQSHGVIKATEVRRLSP